MLGILDGHLRNAATKAERNQQQKCEFSHGIHAVCRLRHARLTDVNREAERPAPQAAGNGDLGAGQLGTTAYL